MYIHKYLLVNLHLLKFCFCRHKVEYFFLASQPRDTIIITYLKHIKDKTLKIVPNYNSAERITINSKSQHLNSLKPLEYLFFFLKPHIYMI